jgi:hypothetical protein
LEAPAEQAALDGAVLEILVGAMVARVPLTADGATLARIVRALVDGTRAGFGRLATPSLQTNWCVVVERLLTVSKRCSQAAWRFARLLVETPMASAMLARTIAMVVVPPKTERVSSPSAPTPRAASCKSLLTPVSDPPQLHSCRGRCHGVGGLVAEEHDENQLTSAQSHRVLRDAAMTTWARGRRGGGIVTSALFTCQTRPASVGLDEQNQ